RWSPRHVPLLLEPNITSFGQEMTPFRNFLPKVQSTTYCSFIDT
ncbi:unnamed protein product, partial [Mycena citricolor]